MILAADIGNTNIVFGLFGDGKLIHSWRSDTTPKRSLKEYSRDMNRVLTYLEIRPEEVIDVIVSSVVPEMDGMIEELATDLFDVDAKFVGPGSFKKLKIKAKKDEVGTDRLVNAEAAYRLYGGPAVVVDFGTATTFCAVSKNGEYLGGAIAPGIGMARDSLHEKTAKLPKVAIEFPKKVIGKDTINAMRSGLFYGYVAMTEGMIERFKKEISGKPKVIATGGFAGEIQKRMKIFDEVDPNLTLEGLRLIWEDMHG